jgi:glyoxylase-like metal-dependent hydrolase (beta-lactamase superfamily II)
MNMTELSQRFSRRAFVAGSASFAAFHSAANLLPLPALAAELQSDSRLSQTVVVDKGFASVRKVGNGLYATISDTSKGLQTMCNGGFLAGQDSALLLEGFVSPAGAAFQMDAFRSVSQVPVKAALDTHYHFDHSTGNSFYGANNVPVWAHAAVARRIVDAYGPMQGAEKAAVLAPLEARVRDAKSDLQRQHAQSDVAMLGNIYALANASILALPNHPIDPTRLPMTIDLGGLTARIESFPGHSGTDLIVRVPDQNVVYTGDLIFSGSYPYCFDEKATISGWRATLRTFASWDKDTLFVPGHGHICGQQGVATLAGIFDDMAEQAEKMHKAGVPVQDAADQYVIPDKFKNFPAPIWGFTIGSAITKLYAEQQTP